MYTWILCIDPCRFSNIDSTCSTQKSASLKSCPAVASWKVGINAWRVKLYCNHNDSDSHGQAWFIIRCWNQTTSSKERTSSVRKKVRTYRSSQCVWGEILSIWWRRTYSACAWINSRKVNKDLGSKEAHVLSFLSSSSQVPFWLYRYGDMPPMWTYIRSQFNSNWCGGVALYVVDDRLFANLGGHLNHCFNRRFRASGRATRVWYGDGVCVHEWPHVIGYPVCLGLNVQTCKNTIEHEPEINPVNFWRENQTVGILGGKHTQGPPWSRIRHNGYPLIQGVSTHKRSNPHLDIILM